MAENSESPESQDRRKKAMPVLIERRRQKSLPAWAGTSSRLAVRAKEAQQARLRGSR